MFSLQQRGCYRTSAKRASATGRITNPRSIWLPTVMVAFAILGHILVYRRWRAGG